MSLNIQPLRTAALAAISAAGALVFLDTLVKPSRAQKIAGGMMRDLDVYNAGVVNPAVVGDSEHCPTLFDRKKIRNDVNARKPWNMTYADKEMSERGH